MRRSSTVRMNLRQLLSGEVVRRILLLSTRVNSPKKPLDDLQINLPYAALDVYVEVDIRFAVGVVDV
jgi:hypothetical protein